MTNIYDYLQWRGDLTFDYDPPNAVDHLILATFSYIHLDGILPADSPITVSLGDAAKAFFKLSEEEQKKRIRNESDVTLFQTLAKTARFQNLHLAKYVSIIDTSIEVQFAALTILSNDNHIFIVFRGTDQSLVGWKEDFNLSFLDTIPGQRLASEYLLHVTGKYQGLFTCCGHSKGGNLAVYATANAPKKIQDNILSIYNFDGPGFNSQFLNYVGYLDILPKVHTYVPQSSIIGMLLEHEEPYTVVQSSNVGLLQHDPYSWGILGKDFIELEEITNSSRIVDQAIRTWITELSKTERENFVEAIYEIILETETEQFFDLAKPQNIYKILKILGKSDEKTKGMVLKTISLLGQSFSKAMKEMPGNDFFQWKNNLKFLPKKYAELHIQNQIDDKH